MAARELFLDASYLIALAVPADEHHARACEFVPKLETSARLLVTTQAVLFEVADALSKPRHRLAAVRLLESLAADPRVSIVPTDGVLYQRALDLFSRRADKEWSLTDCVSFLVMEDHGLSESLTTDEHFEQAGFVALLSH
jgi:predicted nucleic acid-binding protein